MKNIISLVKVAQKLNFILNKEQKRSVLMSFIWMIIGSSLELLGVSAIYPFIQLMINPDGIKDLSYMSWIYKFDSNISNVHMIMIIGILFIAIYLLKNGVMIYASYFQAKVAARVQCDLAVDMMNSYMQRPYEYFLNMNSSEIVTSVTTDVGAVHGILNAFLQMISEVVTIILLTVYLVAIDFSTAIASMILMGCCFLFVTVAFKQKIKQAGKDSRNSNKELNATVFQTITGIKDILVTDRKDNFEKKFLDQAKIKERCSVIDSLISAFPDRIIEGVCVAGFMCIICIKIYYGSDIASFTPVVGSFAMGAFKILPSIAKVSSRLSTIIFKMPSLSNCYSNFKHIRNENREYTEYSNDAINTTDDGTKRLMNEIRVDSITWHYKNADKNVLENASLTIEKGTSVAFIGSSGAGKTTLADIVLGLLHPQKGAVYMDGVDIMEIPHSWAKTIGYVPQSVFLFDDTVRANVAFGMLDDDISDEKVWYALEQAQLKEFVEGLPNGLDTIVGERGVKFSGGQRQRVAIARAMYVDPDVIVLDEATSALDTETETAVMESVDALQGKKTLIIVAHRLSTIENCDVIFEVEDKCVRRVDKSEIYK